MHVKKPNLLFAILFVSVCLYACQSEETEKKADIPKDSTAAGNGTGGAKKTADSSSANSSANSTPAVTDKTANNSAQKNNIAAKVPDDKTKDATTAKKAVVTHDTAASVTATTPVKNNVPVVTDNTKVQAPDAQAADKPFVYKYGLIPWDATENNITSFKDAFPDKQTSVRINFDNDPDAAMQSAKATVMAALKKAGYTNVNEQSKTFHPARIPKEIHYELQHDNTVVIWVPPVVNTN